jgi:hypothetical protein
MILLILAGLATALNYMILVYKFKSKMWKSFCFDLSTFIILNVVFLGTVQGMTIAMISSAILSMWSWFSLSNKKPRAKINYKRFVKDWIREFRNNWSKFNSLI